MAPTPLKTKIAGFAFALIASASVLGATVGGMVAGQIDNAEVIALERTVVSAPAIKRS